MAKRRITAYKNADGTLHAANPNHPGVREQDLIEVLSNLALVEEDSQKNGVLLATGATSNPKSGYDVMTVVYADNGRELFAITAYPARPRQRREYLRRVCREDKKDLCPPVEPTT